MLNDVGREAVTGVGDRFHRPPCQSARNRDPRFAWKRDPFSRRAGMGALASAELAGVAQPGRARRR
jgi:hypothetical protein